MELKEGVKAPDILLPNKEENEISLKTYEKKWIVIYFYPKDNTSGCTKEAIDFSKHKKEFNDRNCVIIGISPDSCNSHSKFSEKHNLTVELLSDTEKTALQNYNVWQLKKRFGKEYFGVVRTTFLIDPDKIIRKIWKNVRVNGHVERVLKELEELQKTGR